MRREPNNDIRLGGELSSTWNLRQFVALRNTVHRHVPIVHHRLTSREPSEVGTATKECFSSWNFAICRFDATYQVKRRDEKDSATIEIGRHGTGR